MANHITFREHPYTQSLPEIQQFGLNLSDQLHNLRSRTIHVATAYRDLGLHYHNIPMNLIFDGCIRSQIRGFARLHFITGRTRELPSMIQLVGLLDHTLRSAAAELSDPGNIAKARRAHRLLLFCETWIQEADELLDQIWQAVNVYQTVRGIRRLQGKKENEGMESKRRRERFRQAWCSALPSICWKDWPQM